MTNSNFSTFKIEKETEDVRGKIIWLSHKTTKILVIETKKGFMRGGHFHEFETENVLIKGKIDYKQLHPKTNNEFNQIYTAPYAITVPANAPHLLCALEDSIFVETFQGEYQSENYVPYRKLVEEKMKQSDSQKP